MIIAAFLFLMISVPLTGLESGALQEGEKPFPESRMIRVGTNETVRIHVRYWQNTAGKPAGQVVLVHGFAGSTFSWRKNVPALTAAGYRVLAVDLPAYGFSDRRTGLNHSPFQRAEWLLETLEKITASPGSIPAAETASRERWIVAGHSMGGSVAGAFAMLYPERTRAVVLAAGAVYQRHNPVASFFTGLWPFRPVLESWATSQFHDDARMKELLSSAYGREAEEEAWKGYQRPLLLPGTASAIVDSIVRSGDRRKIDMKKIRPPVLLVWGEKDSWVNPENAHRITNERPESRLEVIPGAGHCSMETHSGEFNRILLDFLAVQP